MDKEYKKDIETIKKKLALSEGMKLNTLAQPTRRVLIEEAIGFPRGPNQAQGIITPLYSNGDYLVAVEKPGKEAALDYANCTDFVTRQKTNNKNDMLPVILKKNVREEKKYSFSDIFEMIEHLMRSDLLGLELLGMVLFRMAFCLDHKVEGDKARLDIDSDILEILKRRLPVVGGMPIEVFIFFIETLSLNEDVKYYTLNYNPEYKADYGRVSTLLTLVNLISVLLNRTSLAKFAGNFARIPIGISPIAKTKIREFFPLFV